MVRVFRKGWTKRRREQTMMVRSHSLVKLLFADAMLCMRALMWRKKNCWRDVFGGRAGESIEAEVWRDLSGMAELRMLAEPPLSNEFSLSSIEEFQSF